MADDDGWITPPADDGWITPEAAPEGLARVGRDVGQLGLGGAEGMIGFLDTASPGAFIPHTINKVSGALGSNVHLPTPGETAKYLLGKVNADPGQYPAKNLEEKLFRTTGEFLGNPLTYTGAGGIGQKVATAIPAAIGSELAGHAAEGSAWELPARLAGALAGSQVPRLVTGAPPPPPRRWPGGVKLSQGQDTGDLSLIQREQAALRGTSGPPAQRRAQQFADQQESEIEGMRSRIARSLDPNRAHATPLAESPAAAGEMVSEGMRQTRNLRRGVVRDKYQTAEAQPGDVLAPVFDDIGTRIKTDLSAGPTPVVIDSKLTPFAARAVDDIDQRVARMHIENRADPHGQPPRNTIYGINLKGIDQMRRRLASFRDSAFRSGNAEDGRAAQAVLDAFRQQIDDAVNGGMFTGDARAIHAWNDARMTHADFKSDFGKGKGDPIGGIVERILGTRNNPPAIANDVADFLYGSSGVNPSSLNVGVARRVQRTLGGNSPEWAAVRQGLFARLVTKPEGVTEWGPRQVANRVNRFLNGDGRELAETVFTDKQRAAIQRYADVHDKVAVPQAGANWSNTATFNKVANTVARVLGAGIGGALAHVFAPGTFGLAESAGAIAGERVGKRVGQHVEARRVGRQFPMRGNAPSLRQRAAQRLSTTTERRMVAGRPANVRVDIPRWQAAARAAVPPGMDEDSYRASGGRVGYAEGGGPDNPYANVHRFLGVPSPQLRHPERRDKFWDPAPDWLYTLIKLEGLAHPGRLGRAIVEHGHDAWKKSSPMSLEPFSRSAREAGEEQAAFALPLAGMGVGVGRMPAVVPPRPIGSTKDFFARQRAARERAQQAADESYGATTHDTPGLQAAREQFARDAAARKDREFLRDQDQKKWVEGRQAQRQQERELSPDEFQKSMMEHATKGMSPEEAASFAQWVGGASKPRSIDEIAASIEGTAPPQSPTQGWPYGAPTSYNSPPVRQELLNEYLVNKHVFPESPTRHAEGGAVEDGDAPADARSDTGRLHGFFGPLPVIGNPYLRGAGEEIADRFHNPPREPSVIGTAGHLWKYLTRPPAAYGDREGAIEQAVGLAPFGSPVPSTGKFASRIPQVLSDMVEAGRDVGRAGKRALGIYSAPPSLNIVQHPKARQPSIFEAEANVPDSNVTKGGLHNWGDTPHNQKLLKMYLRNAKGDLDQAHRWASQDMESMNMPMDMQWVTQQLRNLRWSTGKKVESFPTPPRQSMTGRAIAENHRQYELQRLVEKYGGPSGNIPQQVQSDFNVGLLTREAANDILERHRNLTRGSVVPYKQKEPPPEFAAGGAANPYSPW